MDNPIENLRGRLPATTHAQLRATYEAAKTALTTCEKIDECQDWADKAAALASRARQIHDSELEDMARRIRARAIRRSGELLRQIEPSKGGRPLANQRPETKDTGVPSSRIQAARDAGLTERQSKTALRVANVPETEFEDAVETEKPALISELAKRGITHRQQPAPPKPECDLDRDDLVWDRRAAKHFLRDFDHFVFELEITDLEQIRRGLKNKEIKRLEEQCELAEGLLFDAKRTLFEPAWRGPHAPPKGVTATKNKSSSIRALPENDPVLVCVSEVRDLVTEWVTKVPDKRWEELFGETRAELDHLETSLIDGERQEPPTEPSLPAPAPERPEPSMPSPATAAKHGKAEQLDLFCDADVGGRGSLDRG